MSDDVFEDRFDQAMAESDPEKRLAMARRLRAEVWDLISDADLERVKRTGLDVSNFRGAVRKID